jgi:hypothetical protein
MRKQQFVRTAVCNKYQTLLEECESALAIWIKRRAKISELCLVGKETSDELLRLRAKCARAYTLLEDHAHSCSVCQLGARLEGRDLENSSASPFDISGYR